MSVVYLSDETAGAHCGRDATLRDDEGSQAEVTALDYEDDVMMLMMMVAMIKDPRLRCHLFGHDI